MRGGNNPKRSASLMGLVKRGPNRIAAKEENPGHLLNGAADELGSDSPDRCYCHDRGSHLAELSGACAEYSAKHSCE